MLDDKNKAVDDRLLIRKTIEFVQETLKNAEGGHDWWHIYRVWKLAKKISINEKANVLVVELGALLHDIADSKFYEGDESIGPKMAQTFLEKENVNPHVIQQVLDIIKNISFKGGNTISDFYSLELAIVQDADRLDAIGAVGIARAFNYGGFKNRKMYDPTIPPRPDQTREEYKSSTAPTINHFYEKLLRLKDLMNTDTGKKMAECRHQRLTDFLCHFYEEWEGIS